MQGILRENKWVHTRLFNGKLERCATNILEPYKIFKPLQNLEGRRNMLAKKREINPILPRSLDLFVRLITYLSTAMAISVKTDAHMLVFATNCDILQNR